MSHYSAKDPKIIFFVIFFSLLCLARADFALAGFGITPPYVKNEGLTRNSVYEQKILIVRGDPDEDLKAVISVDVPGINSWFSVDRGKEFLLPRGESKTPIVIKVTVPDNADYKRYKGNIRIVSGPLDESQIQGVSIALGAQIDVDINVVDEKIYDFRVRKISLADLNEGYQWWWFYYPGKIKFDINIENTGNVSVAPSKVEFNIYDRSGENLLEMTRNSNRLSKIKPFERGDITAELPTRLPAGSYVVRYKIYNLENVKQEGELTLSILPRGTIEGDEGYGFMGLTSKEKAIIVLPFLLAFAVIANFTVRPRRRRRASKTTTRIDRMDRNDHILRLRR